MFDNTTNVINQIRTVMILSDEAVDEIVKAYYWFENSDKLNFNYKEFIKCVYKYTGIKVTKNIIMDRRIKDALTYIQLKLDEPITCKDVANYIFLSEGRFSHLFSQQVGMTFSSYRNVLTRKRNKYDDLSGR